MIVKRSATVKATPETIWSSCFEKMNWDSWDPDVKEMKDVSGDCVNDTTFVFVMNDGTNFPMKLSNVTKFQSLTASGVAAGCLMKATLIVLISPIDEKSSNIDYSFGLSGPVGTMFGFFKKKLVVDGTEGGLANMVKISEEAQK